MRTLTNIALVLLMLLLCSRCATVLPVRNDSPIPCDTDTDCMLKNGGNGGPEVAR